MVSIRFASVLAVATMALRGVAADPPPEPSQTVKNPITTPTVILAASAMTDIGCFETGVPLENHGHFQFRSPGNCQLVCLELDKDVMGLSDGENCWCGDLIPPEDSKVNNSTCSTTCRGDDTSLCKFIE
jgi:cell wall integrity and stress response component